MLPYRKTTNGYMEEETMTEKQIQFVNFNQDQTFFSLFFSFFNLTDSVAKNRCVVIGTNKDYSVYTLDPLRRVFKKDSGMQFVQMLYSSSLLAVVGTVNPQTHSAPPVATNSSSTTSTASTISPRRLQLYNTSEDKVICELNFMTSILNVLLSKKRLIVILETKIHIFDIANLKILRTIETEKNSKGICALSMPRVLATNSTSEETVSYIAYPSSETTGDVIICEVNSPHPVSAIKAHKTPVTHLSFNSDGSMLATASGKGTIIRIFSIPSAELLYTLRRGSSTAAIYSIAFNQSSSMVCVTSEKGTIHLFKLSNNNSSSTTTISVSQQQSNNVNGTNSSISSPNSNTLAVQNQESLLTSSPNVKKKTVGTAIQDSLSNLMFEGTRDFAHARFKSTTEDMRNICAFGNPHNKVIENCIYLVSFDGYIHRFSFDTSSGGEMHLDFAEKVANITEQGSPSKE